MMAWISERCALVRCFLWRFAFDKNFIALSKREQLVQTFREKVSAENPRNVELSQCKPRNRKFREENEWNGKSWVYFARFSSFAEISENVVPLSTD